MVLERTLDRFTSHLAAAEALKSLLDEMAPVPASHDRPVRGHEDRKPLNRACLIESEDITRHAPVPLHGSVLRGQTLLLSTPDDRESLSWAAACVGLEIDRVVHLLPAATQGRSPLMANPKIVSADGALAATFTCRRTFRHKKNSADAQHDYHVLLSHLKTEGPQKGLPEKGSARKVQVLDAPLLRGDRQTDPGEILALLSMLPDRRACAAGRLAIMAPHLEDEAAILAAAVDVTAAVDRRMAAGESLSDEVLDDLVLEACVHIRSSCSADLFHHADQLATLRCVAHDWRRQQEREARREGFHRGREVARSEPLPAARYGASPGTWPPRDPAAAGAPPAERRKSPHVRFHDERLSTTVKVNHPTASALSVSARAPVDFREDKPNMMSREARMNQEREDEFKAAADPVVAQAAGADIASSR